MGERSYVTILHVISVDSMISCFAVVLMLALLDKHRSRGYRITAPPNGHPYLMVTAVQTHRFILPACSLDTPNLTTMVRNGTKHQASRHTAAGVEPWAAVGSLPYFHIGLNQSAIPRGNRHTPGTSKHRRTPQAVLGCKRSDGIHRSSRQVTLACKRILRRSVPGVLLIKLRSTFGNPSGTGRHLE
ncbi:auxin-induced protein 10A5 [Anopheles sinensis]|uniref:Auxin-induced protein 10A5 n=1 Tax=Anopheles sinensis TaxID=74873 RepID=A0A084VEW2_ANOSI|nr:auxin-induced protein 10A5 [Anopheles sinensis]